MRRRYHVLDVFTDTPLGGNPLAVVLDSDVLDARQMQAVAREFNLSETVFVAPPHDPTNSASLRIFTPSVEMPFAGHPTVGAAILIAEMRVPELLGKEDVGLVLEMAIGTVACSVRHRRGEVAHARFETPRLAERIGEASPKAILAEQLGLTVEDIGFGSHGPTRFSAGVPFTFVPLASIDALRRADPRTATEGAYYLYTPGPDTQPRTFRSRMFATTLGVHEDPATGSAAVAFAGVLAANETLPCGEHDCFLHQGVEMGRPSKIGLAFSLEGGRLVSTAVGGSAVMIAEGTLKI